jgi:hypothetical protein
MDIGARGNPSLAEDLLSVDPEVYTTSCLLVPQNRVMVESANPL